MMKTLTALLTLSLASLLSSEAAVYVHVDETGTAHFTDAPTKPYFRRLPGFGLPPGVNLVRGRYAELINQVATEEGMDPALVRAIIRAESNFDSHAVSRKGARGLMQLMPDTAGRYAVENVFDPEANIRGGVRYLRFLHDMFAGRLSLVVAAYNAGENSVLRHNGVPPYAETQQYVARVLGLYGRRDAGGGQVDIGSSPRRATPRSGRIASAATVFRSVDANGTPVYTNLPPLSRVPQAPAR